MIVIGCLLLNVYSHPVSVETEQTTVIKMSEIEDPVTKFRAINDPEVAAVLKSYGITKVEDYIYVDNKRIEKHVSYKAEVFTSEEAKKVVKNISQVLPGMIAENDLEKIYSVFANVASDTGRQKRGRGGGLRIRLFWGLIDVTIIRN